MVSHHPIKFVGHRYCGSRGVKFLVAGKENSRCSRFSPLLLFISKDIG